MTLLDPDSRATWHADFEALVYNEAVWPRIEAQVNANEDSSIEFMSQITCAPEGLRDSLAIRLRGEGKNILFNRHSHVAAFHGCRPRDQRTYREHGLLPSDTDALIVEARRLFHGIPGFDRALSDIGAQYIRHNRGKIGFLMSAIRAKFDGNEHTKGSELIRALANRLGPEARARLRRTGTPTLIKCAIPLDWLDNHTTFRVSTAYVSDIIAQLILWRKWPDDGFHGFSGGFLLTRPIPPENILEFIDMSEFSEDD